MDDGQIVELFLQRSEGAIREAERSHGKTLLRLARNVLGNGEDARECVNDALLAAWNSIPPQEPADLIHGEHRGRFYVFPLCFLKDPRRWHLRTKRLRRGHFVRKCLPFASKGK